MAGPEDNKIIKEYKELYSERNEYISKLNKIGVSATLRRSQGSDIEGACGMLRAKTLKEKE